MRSHAAGATAPRRLNHATFAALSLLWLVAVHLITSSLSLPHKRERRRTLANGVGIGDAYASLARRHARSRDEGPRGDSYQELLSMRSKMKVEGNTSDFPELRKRDMDAETIRFMRGQGYENLINDVDHDWLYNGRRNPNKGGWTAGVRPSKFR